MSFKIFDKSGFFTNLPKEVDGDIYLHQFPTGENYCQFKENIRGKDVYLVADTNLSANDCLIQLMIEADAARRASAGCITAVLPYFFYSRQDRKDKSRTPISAKLIMDLLASSGFSRVITLDLHNPAIQGFSNLPVDNLSSEPIFCNWLLGKINNMNKSDFVIASPDAGGIKKAMALSELIGLDFAYCTKTRKNDTEVKLISTFGNVDNKTVIIYDDVSESLSTIDRASDAFYSAGAREVVAFVSHAPLTELGLDRLNCSKLKKLVSTNTFSKFHNKLKHLDISYLFLEAIQAVSENTSISNLFKIKGY